MIAAGADLLSDPDGLVAADTAGLLPAAATAGAQVRAVAAQLVELDELDRPRAFVVAGPDTTTDAALLAALAGPGASAPIVAVQQIPAWVGPLDIVVVLAATVHDRVAAEAAAVAGRRGSTVVVRSAAHGPVPGAGGQILPPTMAVPESLAGPARLALLAGVAGRCGLLPTVDLERWASGLDAAALACHPSAQSFVNPALAIAQQLVDGPAVFVGTDPLADAVAAAAVSAVGDLAGLPATAVPAQVALGSPTVLRRAAVADSDLFADPDEGPPGARAVVVTIDVQAPAAGAIMSALRLAPVITPTTTGAAESTADLAAGAAELLLRFTFAACYLGMTVGQLAPADSPDGLGRPGTALGAVRIEDRNARRDVDPRDDEDLPGLLGN